MTRNCKAIEVDAANKPEIHIRWAIRRDLPRLVEIATGSFEHPWSDDDFVRCFRQRNCIGLVVTVDAQVDEQVTGYVVYEFQKHRLHILNIAIHPDWRRLGLGSELLTRLYEKLSPTRRNRIWLEVREANLPAHLWLKANGFKATAVLRGFFDDPQADTQEDAYLMERRYTVSN